MRQKLNKNSQGIPIELFKRSKNLHIKKKIKEEPPLGFADLMKGPVWVHSWRSGQELIRFELINVMNQC